ncbi:PilT protein domain protein [Candidatus Promineifilum breve]|uniref:PilT protein domain protein n=1 Tax=Candidatus Promineifilum breve TaxID=1806508 RepID=A0A160T3G2_9CHLR|nr:putative toxin-antitoxin system toxin component, PIN family [Candidatus Promineifilum breve]CUS04556.2 PilT protein domain protein [Candidatus Promineifilum breve]
MTSELRFVFDTNSVVSAVLLKQSVSRRAFDRARESGKLLVSVETLSELADVLRRSKFNKYISERERQLFLAAYIREAILIEPTEVIQASRDANDDKFLELAVSGLATLIVTGDRDLLVLAPFRGIPILSPGEFLTYSLDD